MNLFNNRMMNDALDALAPFVRIKGVRFTIFGDRSRMSPGLLVAELALLTLMLVPVYQPFDEPRWYWVVAALCALVGYGGMHIEMKRLRPRKRALRSLWLLAMLAVLFLVVTLFFAADAPEQGYHFTTLFAVLTVLAAARAVWAAVRWRRLRAEAEIRLWSLRTQRSKNRSKR